MEEHRSCRTETERNQMEWDGTNCLGEYREDRDERTVRVGIGRMSTVLRLSR